MAALLAITAVVLNWLTTGDHLVKTVFTHTYWPVAGVDLSLLATAALSVFAARKLKLREQPVATVAAQETDLELVGGMKHV